MPKKTTRARLTGPIVTIGVVLVVVAVALIAQMPIRSAYCGIFAYDSALCTNKLIRYAAYQLSIYIQEFENSRLTDDEKASQIKAVETIESDNFKASLLLRFKNLENEMRVRANNHGYNTEFHHEIISDTEIYFTPFTLEKLAAEIP
jgi:hypothetical protein